MKMTIEPTTNITYIDGVPVRVWHGVTERGSKCFVFIHRIAVHNDQDQAQFDEELKETLAPGQIVSLRYIL